MAWRYHGHATTDMTRPVAYAICDRCGQLYNRSDLQWQFDYRSTRLMNLRLLVCIRCCDVPQNQYRPIIVPPDPVPIRNPRPDLYAPLMTRIVTDVNGKELDDTTGAFSPVLATDEPSPPKPPAPGIAGNYNYTTPRAIDQYTIEAPDGGPILLIPD